MRTNTEIGETELLTLRRISIFTPVHNHGCPVGMDGSTGLSA